MLSCNNILGPFYYVSIVSVMPIVPIVPSVLALFQETKDYEPG
jgi:hypothetical protein